jgi:hypothetical protein
MNCETRNTGSDPFSDDSMILWPGCPPPLICVKGVAAGAA